MGMFSLNISMTTNGEGMPASGGIVRNNEEVWNRA